MARTESWRDKPHNWFIIITNPQCETKAAGELRRAGIRVYVPKRTIERKNKRTGVVSVKHRPAWTGYLLVRFPEEMRKHGIPFGVARKCQGVKDFVKWVGADGYEQPIPFPDGMVGAYMRHQRYGEFDEARQARLARAAKRAKFKPGARVVITQGPFASFLARLTSFKGDVATLVVEIFGRETEVRVNNFADSIDIVAKSREAA